MSTDLQSRRRGAVHVTQKVNIPRQPVIKLMLKVLVILTMILTQKLILINITILLLGQGLILKVDRPKHLAIRLMRKDGSLPLLDRRLTQKAEIQLLQPLIRTLVALVLFRMVVILLFMVKGSSPIKLIRRFSVNIMYLIMKHYLVSVTDRR